MARDNKEKKPFYKRVWFIVLVVLLLAGGCSSVMGGGSDDSSSKSSSGSSDTSEVKEKTYKIGDTVKAGKIAAKVTGKKTAKSVGGTYGKKAQGTYLIINIEVTNKSDEQITLNSSDFKIKNGSKEYEQNSDAQMYLGDKGIVFEEVNPDITFKGQLIYDVSDKIANSKDNKLEVTGDFWGTDTALISLK